MLRHKVDSCVFLEMRHDLRAFILQRTNGSQLSWQPFSPSCLGFLLLNIWAHPPTVRYSPLGRTLGKVCLSEVQLHLCWRMVKARCYFGSSKDYVPSPHFLSQTSAEVTG